MHSIETLTIEQIDAMMTGLRSRRKVLKSSGKGNQRKIVTLARRRERLIEKINLLDEQISQLSNGQEVQTQPVATQGRAHRTQVAECLDAILACVQNHAVTKRATIIEKCHLSPANASTYLRQLCQEGRLIRTGEKSAATYSLP